MGDQLTFGDVAMTVLSKKGCGVTIDVIFDTYKELSIKNSKSQLRGEDSVTSLAHRQ